MKKFIAILMAALLCLSLFGCGSGSGNSDNGSDSGSADSGELTEITFALDWTPNTNHTGLYVAQQMGIFEQYGLDVTIVQPADDSAEVMVASQMAQFGMSFQDTMMPAVVGDEALPIAAMAAVVQHNTSGIISRAGEGMDHPAGLEGHTYATWDMDIELAMMRNVVEADGGNFDNVQLIPSNVTDEVSALQTNAVDSIWIFAGWAGVACDLAGLETDYFAFSDITPEFDYYTPVIIGNTEWCAENPDAARAFMAAVSEGYTYAAEHPSEAADMLLEAVPELASSEELVRASQEYLSARYIDDAESWGVIDPARWNAFYQWISDNGLSAEPIAENTGFDTQYLPG